jgi:hypothetical protein
MPSGPRIASSKEFPKGVQSSDLLDSSLLELCQGGHDLSENGSNHFAAWNLEELALTVLDHLMSKML